MTQKHTAKELITKLGLTRIPEEGGFFRETYRSLQETQTPRGVRACGTAIYVLITPDEFSTLHRVSSDEIFHFYAGSPVEMFQLFEDGLSQKITLGSDVFTGQFPQVVVPAGVWQGTRLQDGGAWALLGCTVSPGFEFADFELADRARLVQRFPALAPDISRFCPTH